jgi:hypothetical protein
MIADCSRAVAFLSTIVVAPRAGSELVAWLRLLLQDRWCSRANPSRGRLGTFCSSLKHSSRRASCNSPTGRLGIFHSGLQRRSRRVSRKSPNRKVGDLSLRPTATQPARLPQIPQPERLGIFHSGLQRRSRRVSRKSPNRKVGDLSLRPSAVPGVGWRERTPTFRLGDSWRRAGICL